MATVAASPDPSELEALAARYLADARPDPRVTRGRDAGARPWVMANMVTSFDGAVAIDGVSGGLGGAGDLAVFRALRSLADVIVVAAGTARAEDYRPPTVHHSLREARAERGQAPTPSLAVVTRRLQLDVASRLFDDGHRPTVITTTDADADARARLADRVELVEHGTGEVDLAAALEDLGHRGARVVLLEGGPRLNGAMAERDLIDEFCVTVAPKLVGGPSGRIVTGEAATLRDFALERVVRAGDELFCRYLRRR